MAELGDIAGAPDNLPYSSQVYAYMRMLAKASPRVRVWTIGHTEEGREMIAVARGVGGDLEEPRPRTRPTSPSSPTRAPSA